MWTAGGRSRAQSQTGRQRRCLQAILQHEARRLYPGSEIRGAVWGDVQALDVVLEGRKIFSVQIADRTSQLGPSVESPWGSLRIESLTDNLASKMSALVRRGSPRDFLDIYTTIRHNLATWEGCWALWQMKNSHHQIPDGQLAVRVHLIGIKARRPLTRLPEEKRASAVALRRFFDEKLAAAPDPEP